MATYVNNLRLKEITTGDEDGTWGTSTNTNLELIGDGLGYGTEQVAADSNETFTMADGTADGVRAMYLKFTSAGSLTATRTLTLAPNTVSKVWIIENATTGSQIITIKQGSGGTVNIASGTKKLVYTDGAGAGAAVYTGLDADTAGADIASATATDLTAATGNTVVITGTTTATSLTMNVGQQMILLPSAAWPLTYHATTMNINGGVSYTCAAGDRIYAVKDLAGVIRVSVFKQDGTALVPGAAASVAVGDITGAGTGVLTALAVNVGSAGAPVVLGGALGTPSGGTLTNATGLPISTGVSGLATNVATFLGTSSSANLATAVTDETGSGSLVFGTSPTLVTPALGTPSAAVLTSATGLPLTTGVTGTLPVANGGTGATTLTANNVVLGNGTSAVQVVAPSTSGNLLTSNGTTWQSTAPAGGGFSTYVLITASATYTIPAATIKIYVVGAGGGSGANFSSSGGAGGTSTFAYGAASTVTGTGGAGGGPTGTYGCAYGGGGIAGDIHISGAYAESGAGVTYTGGTFGGTSALGGGNGGGSGSAAGAGMNYGGGAGGTQGNGTGPASGGGGGGGMAIKYITGQSGVSATIVIGAGGTAGVGGSSNGAAGFQGCVIVEY